ncbi:MAG: DUF2177 family protein [Pseudolabrys sp.]|jgi:uncharacterized membrane protein|nr:DUF2177 family protein [Pseudolabrys sp.]
MGPADRRSDVALYAVVYVSILAVFVVLDGIWLSQMGQVLYRPILGDILADKVRIAPAVIFYLIYPLGIEIFAVLPALRANSLPQAAIYAALFGLFAYATYDLTNHATLRNWTASITVIDLAWGAFATGLAASLAFLASRAVMSHFDLKL